MRRGPSAELQSLRKFVEEAERQFLSKHIAASAALGTPTREEELDVAAFVVLTHGAIENFIEGIGFWVLESVEHSWTMKKRSSKCLASMMLYTGSANEDHESTVGVFDNLRRSITVAKSAFSKSIADNNGVAMRHLRAMFRPLGLDVPEDPQLSGALELLVSLRHQWAHQFRYGAKVTKFASDIKITADDCLTLAERLAKGAVKSRP